MSTRYDTILKMTKHDTNTSPDTLQQLVEYYFLCSYYMLTLFTQLLSEYKCTAQGNIFVKIIYIVVWTCIKWQLAVKPAGVPVRVGSY